MTRLGGQNSQSIRRWRVSGRFFQFGTAYDFPEETGTDACAASVTAQSEWARLRRAGSSSVQLAPRKPIGRKVFMSFCIQPKIVHVDVDDSSTKHPFSRHC